LNSRFGIMPIFGITNQPVMKPTKLILSLSLCAIAFSFTSVEKKENWKTLFNGKDLSGWDTYIGPDLDDKGHYISDPIGLNKDPRHVFTIVKDNGQNVIRVSGENWGAISTHDEYENYHLQLRFKWGQLTWGQKKGQKKDSGLLYHSVGKYGADYGAWMRSHEFQIEEGNCGDYWGVSGGLVDVPVVKKGETDYMYSKDGTLTTFIENGKQGRHCIKGADGEKPSGQWNTLDLYCHGDTSIHVVNGTVAMVLYHAKQNDGGQLSPLANGKIQLQSEGAELFYKDIKIQPIDHLPAALLK
jgi:hypothetical protein